MIRPAELEAGATEGYSVTGARVSQSTCARTQFLGRRLSGLVERHKRTPRKYRTVPQTQATRLGMTDAPETPGNVPPRHDRVYLAIPKGSHKRAAEAQEYRRLLPEG